ncbi:MAG TPA: PAS domain-containing protein [Allosphingosinicella sp.]
MPPVVHIVEPDARLGAALAALLLRHGHLAQCFESAARLLTDARLEEGCVLLDLQLPDMSGDKVLEELARRGVTLPVLAMAEPGDPEAAIRAMKLGAVDYLEKPVADEDLLAAVERALDHWAHDEERRRARTDAETRLERLSPRERQILQGLLGGQSNKAIARSLGLSPRTVEMHRANMMDDLELSSLPEALRLAIDAGLPPLSEDGSEEAPPPASPPEMSRPLVRRAGETERRHDEKLKLVLEASGDGAWEWIIPTSEVRLSTRLVERFGYTPKEAPSRFEGLADFIHPDDWDHFLGEIQGYMEGRIDAFACEFRVRRADGRWAWIFDFGSIVDRDTKTGAPLRMAGSISEITERKEEERRAHQANELLELALWGAGAGIWECDLETRIVRLCRRSRELLGLPLSGSEFIAWEDWEAAIHPDDRKATAAALENAIATGTPVAAEYRTLHPNGTTRMIRGIGKVIADSAGRPRRVVGLHQEIARAEEKPGFSLRRANR